jgi:hypothetical protein
MTLSAAEREHLADVVRLQPTTNGELQKRWDLESGSDVHRYLEEHLADHYYRDDDSYIRATPEAADLVDVEPGIEGDEHGPTAVRVSELAARIVEVIAGPDERSESVVSLLHKLRDRFETDPTPDEVRDALGRLRRTGVVEVVYRTVPTYRLAVERDGVEVDIVH